MASKPRAAISSARACADVTLAEGAMLAALPKGPSAYTPRNDPNRALTRRDLVLALMAREGYLDDIGLAAAAREPLRVAAERVAPAAAGRLVCGGTRCEPRGLRARAPRVEPEEVDGLRTSTPRSTPARSARPIAPCGSQAAAIQQEARRLVGRQRRDDRGRDGRASTRGTATSARSSAGGATSAAASIARSRRIASRARRSSRSCTRRRWRRVHAGVDGGR